MPQAVVCHTRASDVAEASESCWECGEKISGVPSLASYLPDGTQRKDCISNSSEQRGIVVKQVPLPGTQQRGLRLSFDYLPNFFLLDDILISWMTVAERDCPRSQNWKASFISHFELSSHKIFYHQTLSILSWNICPIYPFLVKFTVCHNPASDSSNSSLVLLKTAC